MSWIFNLKALCILGNFRQQKEMGHRVPISPQFHWLVLPFFYFDVFPYRSEANRKSWLVIICSAKYQNTYPLVMSAQYTVCKVSV